MPKILIPIITLLIFSSLLMPPSAAQETVQRNGLNNKRLKDESWIRANIEKVLAKHGHQGRITHISIPPGAAQNDAAVLSYKACMKQSCYMVNYDHQKWYLNEQEYQGITSEEAIRSAVQFLTDNRLDWGPPIGTRRTGGTTPKGIRWFAVEFEKKDYQLRTILVNPETKKAEFPKPR